MTSHLTEEQILIFLQGEHDERTTEDIRMHLAQCSACADAVAKEASLEYALWEVRQHARKCPGCGKLFTDDHGLLRCSHCGVAAKPGGFTVIEVLVKTNHGRLYLANDSEGRKVALKELVFAQVPDEDQLAAFERESRILRQLDHPQIPDFVASFEEGEGVQKRLYLAQEYVEGPSLLARLSDHRFTEKEAADIAGQVLGILEYLQALSPPVFHRDIKPANIICRSDGTICVVDFGAARDLGATEGGTTRVGTFGYMPTEQLAGIVNATTDLHALGATLLHILTRQPPWEVSDHKVLLEKATLTKPFRRFLEQLLASEMSERFSGAAAARRTLQRVLTIAPPTKRRWIKGLFATGFVAASTMAGVMAFQHLGASAGTSELPIVSWFPSGGREVTDAPFNALERTLVAFAVLGAALLALRLLLQAIGSHSQAGDAPGDIDLGHADLDHGDFDHADIEHGDLNHGYLDDGAKLLTFQGASAFLLMFGLVGLALSRQSGLGGIVALLGAASAGIGSMWGIAKLFQLAAKLQSSGTIDTKNAIGQEGTVYLTIPAEGKGKVHVPVQDRLMEFEAISSHQVPIGTGEKIRVVLVRDGNVMVVERTAKRIKE